jgi:hypothetical protein
VIVAAFQYINYDYFTTLKLTKLEAYETMEEVEKVI